MCITQTVPRGWSVDGVAYKGSDGMGINGVIVNERAGVAGSSG